MTTFTSLPSLPTFLPGTNPATEGDAFLAALPTLVSEGNTIGTEVQTNYDNSYEYNKRVNASTTRIAAYLAASASNATLASTLRNAALWVSGTTYSLNAYVFSPTNFRLYRRKIAGAGTTDPSLDTTNWSLAFLETATNLPAIRPALLLSFVYGETLDHKITFTRASSATRVNRKGQIELVSANQPRFDYDPSTLLARGLLIEESRTNLVLNSVIAGTSLSTQSVSVSAVPHTLSFYGTGSITLSGVHSATLSGTGAYPSRATLTFTPSAGSLTLTVSGTVQYCNLEAGSFATSFIPTAGISVTRSADVVTISGVNFSNWFNASEGTFVVNALGVNNTAGSTRAVIEASDATANNRMLVGNSNTTTGRFFCNRSASSQADLSAVIDSATFNEYVATYKANLFTLCSNAALSLNDYSGTVPTCSQLTIGNDYSGTAGTCLNGWIKNITYYRKSLTPLECLELSV